MRGIQRFGGGKIIKTVYQQPTSRVQQMGYVRSRRYVAYKTNIMPLGILIFLFLQSQRACPFPFHLFGDFHPFIDVLRSVRFAPVVNRSACQACKNDRARPFSRRFPSVHSSLASAKLTSLHGHLHARPLYLHAKRKRFFKKYIYFICMTVIYRACVGRGKSEACWQNLNGNTFGINMCCDYRNVVNKGGGERAQGYILLKKVITLEVRNSYWQQITEKIIKCFYIQYTM